MAENRGAPDGNRRVPDHGLVAENRRAADDRTVSAYRADALAALLPDYEIGGVLGEGGWGIVWRATHRSLGHEVAVKQMSPQVHEVEGPQRFAREARMLAALEHPHIVSVHDFVAGDGLMVIVMDLLTGGNARQWAQMDDRSTREVCGVGLAAAAGLAHAHGRQIIHRDVKPTNLLFDRHGAVKVVDFGIGRPRANEISMLTAPGTVLGSPAYLSPEQASGDTVTPASDVYALATSIFELLTDRLPFESTGSIAHQMDAMSRRTTDDAPRLRDIDDTVPEAIADVIDQGLARDPAARFADARVFGHALMRACDDAFADNWMAAIGVPLHVAELQPEPDAEPQGEEPTVELLVTRSGTSPRSITLETTTTIGREDTDVVLDDPEISRRHLSLAIEGDTVIVCDLDSFNGTFIDGERLSPNTPTRLEPGSCLTIGTTRMELGAAAEGEWADR